MKRTWVTEGDVDIDYRCGFEFRRSRSAATMEQRRRPTTEEDISTAVPSTFPKHTNPPMAIDDKVDDMNWP
jgi:hypothetical protein